LYISFKFMYHLVLNLDEIFQGYTSLYFAPFSSKRTDFSEISKLISSQK
jgi:hypothetical protein